MKPKRTKSTRTVPAHAPIRRETTPEERRAAIERMRRVAEGISLKGLRLADLIREGRR